MLVKNEKNRYVSFTLNVNNNGNARHINCDARFLFSAGNGDVSAVQADDNRVGRFRLSANLIVFWIRICSEAENLLNKRQLWL